MPDLPIVAPGLDWIAGIAVLWVGGAAWVTAVASHLGLSEWGWFAFALLTGPVAWVAVFVRLRRERARRRGGAHPTGGSVDRPPGG